MADRMHDHAVVLGASLAGLLTARVLSEHFQRVTIIERDELPQTGLHRKGVPHGRHLHGLHPRGREVLEDFFPGFTARLTDAGAECCDVLGNVRWQLSGHQLRQVHIGLPALLASRPPRSPEPSRSTSPCRSGSPRAQGTATSAARVPRRPACDW
jgi:hypothetical protein